MTVPPYPGLPEALKKYPEAKIYQYSGSRSWYWEVTYDCWSQSGTAWTKRGAQRKARKELAYQIERYDKPLKFNYEDVSLEK